MMTGRINWRCIIKQIKLEMCLTQKEYHQQYEYQRYLVLQNLFVCKMWWNICRVWNVKTYTLLHIFFYFILDTQQKQSNDSSTEGYKNQEKNGRGAQAAGIISIVILMGLLTVLSCWLWRRRSSRLTSYTGNEALYLPDQIWRISFHLPKYLLSSCVLLKGMSKLPAHNSRK